MKSLGLQWKVWVSNEMFGVIDEKLEISNAILEVPNAILEVSNEKIWASDENLGVSSETILGCLIRRLYDPDDDSFPDL